VAIEVFVGKAELRSHLLNTMKKFSPRHDLIAKRRLDLLKVMEACIPGEGVDTSVVDELLAVLEQRILFSLRGHKVVSAEAFAYCQDNYALSRLRKKELKQLLHRYNKSTPSDGGLVFVPCKEFFYFKKNK
jgi:hypothetical protein